MTNTMLKPEEISTSLLTPIQISIFRKLAHKSLTRQELVKSLNNTPRTTIYDNLTKLQKRKLVEKYTKPIGGRGRPIVLWFIPKYILTKLEEQGKKI